MIALLFVLLFPMSTSAYTPYLLCEYWSTCSLTCFTSTKVLTKQVRWHLTCFTSTKVLAPFLALRVLREARVWRELEQSRCHIRASRQVPMTPILWRNLVSSWGGRLTSLWRNTSHSMEIDASRWPRVLRCVHPWLFYCHSRVSRLYFPSSGSPKRCWREDDRRRRGQGGNTYVLDVPLAGVTA